MSELYKPHEEELKIEIAKVVEGYHPGCMLNKECISHCGECGADRIMELIKEWIRR